MYFSVNNFEFGVNDSIFSGNELQKVYEVEAVLPRLYSLVQTRGEG